MSWDELTPAEDVSSEEQDRRSSEAKAVARVMRVALQDQVFRRWLTRLSLGSVFAAGQPDTMAYREGIRALAVRLLHMGGEE